MARERSRRAVVIGAGLSGLVAGHRLKSDGWDVLVLERQSEVGGRCRTVAVGDYLFDTGAQHLRDSFDDTLGLLIGLGLGGCLRLPGSPKGIFRDRKVHRFVSRSLRPLSALPWGAMLPRGILELPAIAIPLLVRFHSYNIRFPWWWKEGDAETAADYLSGRTTAPFRREFAEPVARFAFGAPIEALSAAAFLASLRYTFCDRTGSLTGGMGLLGVELAGGLRVSAGMKAVEVLIEGRRAVGVRARPSGGGRSRTYRADLVVCSVPAPEVVDIVPRLGRAARRLARNTVYGPQVVVNLGVEDDIGGGGGPVLLPLSGDFSADWVCTNRSKALEYAPPGGTAVTLIYSGPCVPAVIDKAEEEILGLALDDATKLYGKFEPARARVDRHQLGRPVPSPGRASLLGAFLEAGSGVDGLFLAGDWTATPTVEGAVSSGIIATGGGVLRR